MVREIDLFLIGGQSNSTGVGTASGSPRVQPGTAYQYVHGTVKAADNPIGPGNCWGYGAWAAFAAEYHKRTGRIVGLVQAAVRASALLPAADISSAGNWSEAGTLYGRAVTMFHDAIKAFSAEGFSPRAAGVLWCQGEQEAIGINASTAGVTEAAYRDELQALIKNFRQDLGHIRLPFYIFRTGTFSGASDVGPAQIRSAQEYVAARDPDTEIVFFNAVDFPARGLMSDTYHYYQAGYNEMGRMGAAAIANGSYGLRRAGCSLADAVSLTSGTFSDIATAELGPGEYEITGMLRFVCGSPSVSMTEIVGVIHDVSASYPSDDTAANTALLPMQTTVGLSPAINIGPTRYTVSDGETKTIYLSSLSLFSGGTLGSYGALNIRRVA